MRFYRPRFVLAALQGPQASLISKLGGLPWGYPADQWPVCNGCAEPQSLVAQLEHNPPALDLGTDGGVLHLFFCANVGCARYGTGLSTAVLLPNDALGYGLTAQPLSRDAAQSINGEAWITAWDSFDDAVQPDQVAAFYDYRAHMALPDEIANPFDFDPRWSCKAAGVPYWTGNGVTLEARTIPYPEFEFLLQIPEYIWLKGRPPTADAIGTVVSICRKVAGETVWEHMAPTVNQKTGAPMGIVHEEGADHYTADIVNFGSDGIGFVFINRHVTPHEVRWFWSR